MPVGAWSLTSPSNKSSASYPAQSGISQSPYNGTIAGVSYNVAKVTTSTSITKTDWDNFVSRVNSEKSRRNKGTFSLSISGNVTAANFNSLRANIQVTSQFSNSPLGGTFVVTDDAYNGIGQGENNTTGVAHYPPQLITSTAPGAQSSATDVALNGLIYASRINQLVDDINNAGAACVCNCNYCSCNCNYCVCNCNYSCTCNCNYSDERLKENIQLVGKEGDLNIYSYTYLWNKTKTYIGVMAQELLGTKYESALFVDKNGYYTVDYSQLPVEFKEA
jgi:hypothetical protein